MIVTLTNIKRAERDTRKGKAMSISIWTEQHGKQMVSGWENDTTKDWVVGQRVGIETKQNGDWLNFQPSMDQPPKNEKQIATNEKTKIDGINLMNAKNNATSLVCEILKRGEYAKERTPNENSPKTEYTNINAIEADLMRLTSYLYGLEVSKEETKDDLPFS